MPTPASTSRPKSPSSSERERLISNQESPLNDGSRRRYNGIEDSHETRQNRDDDENNESSTELSNWSLSVTLSGAYLGGIVCAIDGSVIATISAPISTSFKSMQVLSWLASAFFIASAASQPVAGKLTDIYGRRNGLLCSSAVLVAGNLLCACATAEWILLLGRVVAGLGGGAIAPIVTCVLSDVIPLRRRGIWQGIANIGFGLGSGLGGPFGGWVSDRLGWRWAFALQIPLTVISMVLIVWRLNYQNSNGSGKQPLQKSKFKRIDFLGTFLLVMSVVLMLVGLTSGGNLVTWTHPLVLISLPASFAVITVFVLVEHYWANEPIIPVAMLLERTVASVCLANWFISMAWFGVLFYAPIYFQVQGYSLSQTGLRLIPSSIAIAITSVSCGYIMRKTGTYYALNMGVQLSTISGLALMSTLTLATPAWPPLVYLFLIGVGYSGMLTTTLIALLAAVEQQFAAVMTSASYAFRSTGTVIGICVASAVFQNRLTSELVRRLGHLENGRELISSVERELSNMFDLPQHLKEEVQHAYMCALHVTFLTLLGLASVGVISSLLMKNRTLSDKSSADDDDNDDYDSNNDGE